MKKINLNQTIFYLILIFPISTILQNVSMFATLNKIVMGMLLLLITICILSNKITKKVIFNLFFLCVCYAWALIYTKDTSIVEINMYFYFPFWILFFLYMAQNGKIMLKIAIQNINKIKIILIVFNFLTIISLFYLKSYINGFFSPFGCGEHRYGSCCMLILALNAILAKRSNNKMYIFSLIPAIGISMGGARTYLIIYIVYIMCVYYKMCNKRIKFYITLIPISLIIFALVYLSPIANKIVQTTNDGYYGFLATLTSGRSIFWMYDLKEFFNLQPINQLLGNGFDFIYNVNERYINKRIWAHNDFINIAMNFGYIGIYIYLNSFKYFCQKNIKIKNKIPLIGFYFIWIFNAFFNMVYTYPLATIALPFIADSLKDIEVKDEQ